MCSFFLAANATRVPGRTTLLRPHIGPVPPQRTSVIVSQSFNEQKYGTSSYVANFEFNLNAPFLTEKSIPSKSSIRAYVAQMLNFCCTGYLKRGKECSLQLHAGISQCSLFFGSPEIAS